MRFANPHPPRRGAFLLVALFSCLQILFGFFLFTGDGQDSALPSHSSVQIASYEDGSMFNNIQPALGHEPERLTLKETRISLKESCDDCGTFSFFDEYRRKARDKAAARQHMERKKYLQKKRLQHSFDDNHSTLQRYNPVKRRVVASNNTPRPSSGISILQN